MNRITRRGVVGAAAGVLSGLAAPSTHAQAQVSRRLLARLAEQHAVPGAAFAVVQDGAIVATGATGVRRRGAADAVTDTTLFQACSLSKTVAATVALVLVEQGVVALDHSVFETLRQREVATGESNAERPVTLRRLFGMTAGVNVPGFWGYAPDAPLPNLDQILAGVPPANSPRVEIAWPPASGERYSGGGCQIAEAMLVDATGRPFATLAQDTVLARAGMTRSAFAQPLGLAQRGEAAAGHGPDGTPMPGGGNVFPELAAAGLWSTPSDLARYLITLMRSQDGAGLLSPALFEAMLTRVDGFGYGIGAALRGEGRDLALMKRGHNLGYHCYLIAFPRRRQGAVVMTNGEAGLNLIGPFLRGIGRQYGWPAFGRLAD